MKIVQIGVNKANDDLTKIIRRTEPSLLILVEPLHRHNIEIINCYSWVKNKHIENIAISLNGESQVPFYFHPDDGPLYECASLNKNHLIKHRFNSERIKESKITSLSINQLFEKYKLTDLDILFIDAEGVDDLIIKSINFDKINISKIYFENIHITQNDIYSYLEDRGYKIQKNIGQNKWTTLAEKTLFN